MQDRTNPLMHVINAQRAAVSIVDTAIKLGATRVPNVSVYEMTNGTSAIISFGFSSDDEFPPSEVTRWQLATGAAWDVYGSTVPGSARRHRLAYATYDGYPVHIRFSEPAEIRAQAVRALGALVAP